MYEGYLAVNEVEILNAQRAEKYISTGLPHLQIDCETVGLDVALGDAPYTDPATDSAPWYTPHNPRSADFLGLMPNKITGGSDASREIVSTEKIGDGAAHSSPRHASKEIRVTATAFSITEEGLSIGLAWLRHVLTEKDCSAVFGEGCTGRDMNMFTALPVIGAPSVLSLRRTFYSVEVIDGPLVIENLAPKVGHAKRVEFIFRAGKPWAFSPENVIVSGADLSTGFSHTDVVADCSTAANPYSEFIDDPFFTAVVKPPSAPVMKPPNILKITSWRRTIVSIPENLVQQWGGLTPVVRVKATAAVQQVRLRFWDAQGLNSGPCDYEGEFLISYIPAGATMTIDGIRDSITVTLASGKTVPGSHLVYGSDGLPFTWPDMVCHDAYFLIADMMPGQTGITFDLDLSIRE